MSLFHRHAWTTTGSWFSPPNPALTRARGDIPEVLLAAMHGLTTIRQECTGCGEVALRTAPGGARSAKPTAVHHVNGNPYDNRPENLEIVDPAAHASTATPTDTEEQP